MDGSALAPPQNIEAEMALIGAVLIDNACYDAACGIVQPEHFADPVHGRLWAAITVEIESGRQASPISLKGWIGGDPELGDRGGHVYISRLAGVAALPITVADCARSVRSAATARRIITACNETAADLHVKWATDHIARLISELQQTIDETTDEVTERRSAAYLGAAMSDALTAKPSDGIATGIKALDDLIGGLYRGQLVVMAGSTSMGKSALALGIGMTEARAGGLVAFFSLEMSRDELAQRVLSGETGIPAWKMRRGWLHPDEKDRLQEAAGRLNDIPLVIDDNAMSGVRDVRRRALELRRRAPIRLIVVDYLQLLASDGKGDNRAYEVARITRGLKQLAMELHCPVLALSQLSRQVDMREDKRPQLSDLRESGSIEQDADVVLFCYRPGYYLERKRPTKMPNESRDAFRERMVAWEQEIREADDAAEIIVAKQRQGAANKVALVRFEREAARFVDLPESERQQEAMGF